MDFETDRFISTLVDRAPPHALEHLQLVLIPLVIAFVVAFPVAILLTRRRFIRSTERVMAVFNAGQTIPPLAVIAIFFPFLGLGREPALLALTIYALLPIARNTLVGLKGVPREVIEAARGMGMTDWEILIRVELPLSVPVIMAGVRISAILIAATAALASLVGGGGMGTIIFAGIDFFRVELVLAGTLFIVFIAILLDRVLTVVENILTTVHLKSR